MNTDPRILSTYTRRTVAPFIPVPGALLVEGAESLVPVHRDAAGEWARKVVVRDALYAELRGPARPGHIARLALAADEATTVWVRTVRPAGAVGFIDADGAFIVPMARRFGWLSPEGALFACPSGRHLDLADILDPGGSTALERAGWCVVTFCGDVWAPGVVGTEAQFAALNRLRA